MLSATTSPEARASLDRFIQWAADVASAKRRLWATQGTQADVDLLVGADTDLKRFHEENKRLAAEGATWSQEDGLRYRQVADQLEAVLIDVYQDVAERYRREQAPPP